MADVSKIKLPDNSEVTIKDSRIAGVDTTVTSGSSNVVTSGAVYTAISNNSCDAKVYVIEPTHQQWEENSFTITTQMFDSMTDDAENGRSVILRFQISGLDEGYNEIYDYALTYSSSSNNYWGLQFNRLCEGYIGFVLYLSKEGNTVNHSFYSNTFERQGNRVTSISSGSSNYSYPTAKAVYNFVSGSYAPKASPALTGTPTAPTASAGTNTTQIATTAFVQSAISGVGGLPSASSWGRFLASDWDTTTSSYKWKVSNRLYEFSPGGLEYTGESGICAYNFDTFWSSNKNYSLNINGLVAEADSSQSVFSDWSWIRYRSSYSPSAYVTLQDYFNKHCLPEAYSGLYGSLPTVVYDSTNGYHWGTTGFYISSGILNTENYGSFRAWVNSSGDYIGIGAEYGGVYCSYASDWSWIKFPRSGYTGGYTLQDELDLKAPLASPALTGVPTAPTAASGTNTTQIATTAFVSTAVSGKQDTLVSGTNIKTINNESILGSGNITIQGGGGSTTDCVHKTGDETIAGDKTFTDDIVVGDASNIKYGASAGSGFTRGYADTSLGDDMQTISFEGLDGEPKAFIISNGVNNYPGVLMVVGDSTGTHGVYSAASSRQHNYVSGFTTSYSNGTFSITAPSATIFMEGGYSIVYYYGDGTLTFHTTQVMPGSGATTVTFTDANLTAVPAFYAVMLESQVNNEQYVRVACYTNEYGGASATPIGMSFANSAVTDTTSSFTVSYSNGLLINSGGTNAGGYFHNPGTYTLYYLTSADIGGGGGSYQSLSAELTAITTSVSAKEATSNKVTSLSAQSTDTQYPSAKLVYDQLALKQAAITISSSEPTQYQGNNGDIWIVI